jgi:Glycosyl transferase family 2
MSLTFLSMSGLWLKNQYDQLELRYCESLIRHYRPGKDRCFVDLSVLVATYNRMTHLKRALDSLSCQEGAKQIRWEVIVVDNNSTDGTGDFVRGYAQDCSLNLRYYFERIQGKGSSRRSHRDH